MHHASYHLAPSSAQPKPLSNSFRFRGQCSPNQAQNRILQLEHLGYINIRCDQVNSGWFGELPTYLITAEMGAKNV